MQPNLFSEQFNRTKKQPNTSIKLKIVRSFGSFHTEKIKVNKCMAWPSELQKQI